MDSKDLSTNTERKGLNLSKLIITLICSVAVAAAGITIRTRVGQAGA